MRVLHPAGMMMRAQALLQKDPKRIRRGNSRQAAAQPLPLWNAHADIARGAPRCRLDARDRQSNKWERAMSAYPNVVSRRQVLAGTGALVLSFSSSPLWAQQALRQTPTAKSALPGSLKENSFLDAWIRVSADGMIDVFSGKAELGQGIKTAFMQIAAEQLDVSLASIRLTMADTGHTANEKGFYGRQSFAGG